MERIFYILNRFTLSNPVVSLDEIQTELGTAKSTTFRYFKILCDSGLLNPLGNGSYGIGPRVVELERLVQITDPLLGAGREVMGPAANNVPGTILLLSALYKDKALCIHRAGPEKIVSNDLEFDLIRSRGVPLPLFQGVASLAILAFLPASRIRSIYLGHSSSIAEVGLGNAWPEFRGNLSSYRKKGYVVTVGAYNPHMAGIAVPILASNESKIKVNASLTRTFPIEIFQRGDFDYFVEDLKSTALAISQRWLQIISQPSDLPGKGILA
ncbi:IclR family transcriptional regulator [Ottowia caeni]|uniref:IclR family transcriptional regulator n=1 Tax=Ottowia caeni TaxID=2870339 RepID=UPI003D75800A